ncbi:hypothetical protein [Vagococcus humatus]|uniref:Uncharacterized protein n=1 Tax=Vagococcus humatus TaxID=1889241 RepID=A0A3R9ZWT9_9ENTE|nr:hypothetical protein [Vagococcus humatus]RST89594.1 hypothetical protein C7P63_00495 [Vagococcus humatus]
MIQTLEIKIYQYSAVEGEKNLFNHTLEKVLFNRCQNLYQTNFPNKQYPQEEVESKLTQLLQTVSIEKRIQVSLANSVDFDWQSFILALNEIYPQMIWISGQVRESEIQKIYDFHFIPLAIRQVGFPFSVHLKDSLVQQLFQGATEEDWIKELGKMIEIYLRKDLDTSSLSQIESKDSSVDILEDSPETCSQSEKVTSQETAEELQPKPKQTTKKAIKVSQLVEENKQLRLQLNKLHEQLNEKDIEVNSEDNATYEATISELEKQQVYYETELKQLKDARVRMQLTNDKLNHFIAHLERQMMSSSLDVLEGDPPYVERTKDWYKKRRIPLIEYDRLYQKAKYLEHTWHLNQRLLSMSEQLAFSQLDFSYDFSRINDIRDSAKDIELFVMMDECRVINNRVKIHKGFLWRAPSVTILKNDYENLVEKAAYFDVIQAENQMLERMIKEHKVKDVTEETELLEFEKND